MSLVRENKSVSPMTKYQMAKEAKAMVRMVGMK